MGIHFGNGNCRHYYVHKPQRTAIHVVISIIRWNYFVVAPRARENVSPYRILERKIAKEIKRKRWRKNKMSLPFYITPLHNGLVSLHVSHLLNTDASPPPHTHTHTHTPTLTPVLLNGRTHACFDCVRS